MQEFYWDELPRYNLGGGWMKQDWEEGDLSCEDAVALVT